MGIKPGEIVSGTVAHIGDNAIVVDIPTAKGLVKGYLTFPHLSDNLGEVMESLSHCLQSQIKNLVFIIVVVES